MLGNNKSIKEIYCKSWVNYELAVNNNDISLCEKMDKDSFINDFYGMDSVTYINCYVAIAVNLDKQNICDKMTSSNDKGWCYYEFAVKKKDCSLVPKNSPASISQCESIINQ